MNRNRIFYGISSTVTKYGFENVIELLVRSKGQEAEALLIKLPGVSAFTDFVHRLPLLDPTKTSARSSL